MSDRRQHSVQAGAVDQEVTLLSRTARGSSHEATHPQVARTFGTHHVGLSGDAWAVQGLHNGQRRDGHRLCARSEIADFSRLFFLY